ncbi:MAG: YihY/virulence factor BrkB family protein [Ornithinibacter sp.]
MESAQILLPIPGELVDPPVKDLPERLRLLQAREDAVGTGLTLGMRTTNRFTNSRATLLAAGTTYYLFLAMFSILTLAYGLTAALGADQLSSYITEALSQAFPGLVGGGAVIDPEQLRSVAQTTTIVSLVGLLYGATGAVLAASRSVHAIYGAPNNPRNIVWLRVWAFGWFLVLAPLVLLSFVSTSFTANFSGRLMSALGLEWEGSTLLLTAIAAVLTMVLNFLVVYVVLGRLGGIRPARRPRLAGAAVGSVVTEVLKQAMALLVNLVITKPQYGALAAPIGIMFVLYLQSSALYGVASLTAALAEAHPDRSPAPTESDQGALGDSHPAGA